MEIIDRLHEMDLKSRHDKWCPEHGKKCNDCINEECEYNEKRKERLNVRNV